tara:strand:- start:163 stop:279 length:117 start_codon:yes stop_codon:yes gene_type:complete
MWQELERGWTPPKQLDRDIYYEIKDNKDKFTKQMIGYV